MGFFSDLFGKGKEKAPEIKVPTAQELLGASTGFMQQQFPQFAQARETGLEALMGQGFAPQISIPGVSAITPATISPLDFAQFQPTSFEQGLATSQFGPLMEQAQRQALQIGSLAGIPSAAPAHFGRAISPALLNIGQFLATQGQRRGELELQRRFQEAGFGQQAGLQQQALEQQRLQQQALSTEQARQFNLASAIGQDPFQEIMAGAGLGAQQAGAQSAADILNWQNRQAQMGGGSALLSLLGGGLGALLAAPTGGLSLGMGAALGGAGGGLFGSLLGGGESPIGFQDVALMSLLGGGGGGAAAGAGAGGLFPAGEPLFGGGGLSDLLGKAVPIGGGDTTTRMLQALMRGENI